MKFYLHLYQYVKSFCPVELKFSLLYVIEKFAIKPELSPEAFHSKSYRSKEKC